MRKRTYKITIYVWLLFMSSEIFSHSVLIIFSRSTILKNESTFVINSSYEISLILEIIKPSLISTTRSNYEIINHSRKKKKKRKWMGIEAHIEFCIRARSFK